MSRRPLLWIAASIAGLAIIVPATAVVVLAGSTAPPTRTKHFTVNIGGAEERAKAAAIGFNVFDMGPDSDEINALGTGQQAMIWVGNVMCSEFELDFDEFTSAVDRLGGNDKVYGWYLSDEPIPEECPEVVGEIRKRADYIHAKAPDQKAYIVAGWQYGPIRPDKSHVDLFGMDPYPCRTESDECTMGEIEGEVGKAEAAGIPRSVMAPVYQTFGQGCAGDDDSWRLPTLSEFKRLLAVWDKAVPNPELDSSYSWGNQEGISCPTLTDADGTDGKPDLQSLIKKHHAKAGGPPPAAAPAPTPTAPGCSPTELPKADENGSDEEDERSERQLDDKRAKPESSP